MSNQQFSWNMLSPFLFFATFIRFSCRSAFSSKNFAPGCSKSDANAFGRPVACRHFFLGLLCHSNDLAVEDRFVIGVVPCPAWTGWVSDGGDRTRPRSPDRRR